jgi:hypothetical protein
MTNFRFFRHTKALSMKRARNSNRLIPARSSNRRQQSATNDAVREKSALAGR